MSWGDILAKLAQGDMLSGGEIENLRLIGNTLDNLAGLASRVEPVTGAITALNAGPVFLSRDGIVFEYVIKIKERADAVADADSYGQLWVKNSTPCELWFTDDVGTDMKFTVELSRYSGQASLSASATQAAVGQKERPGASAMSATATVASVAHKDRPGASALSASATVAAAGEVV